jgi:hypothetical protein
VQKYRLTTDGAVHMKKQINLVVIASVICLIASLLEANAQSFQPYWDAANPGSSPGGNPTWDYGPAMVAGGGTLYCIGRDRILYQWAKTNGWQYLASFRGGNGEDTLALNGNFLYVGGSFTSISTNINIGQPVLATNVAKLDLTSGIWSDLGRGQLANSFISDYANDNVPMAIVADANNNVYACFSPFGWMCRTTNTVAFRKFDGTNWAPVGNGLVYGCSPLGMPSDTPCEACSDTGPPQFLLATDGTNIFVGGSFSDGVNPSGLVHSPSIIKWDGTNWQPMGQGISDPGCVHFMVWIRSIAVSGTNVFVTGNIQGEDGGFPGTCLARFSTSGTYIPTVRLLSHSIVEDQDYLRSSEFCYLAARNGIVYVTGDFNTIESSTNYTAFDYCPDPADSITVNGIAQWDGTTWTNLGAGLQQNDLSPAGGWAITADSNAVYVLGGFDLAGGLAATNGSFVRWVTAPDSNCPNCSPPDLIQPRISNGTFSFNISGDANTSWTVYSSTDLKNWTPVGAVTLTNGIGSFTESNVFRELYSFYMLSNGTCCNK